MNSLLNCDTDGMLSILFSQVKEGSIPFSVNFAPMIDKSCFNSDFLTTLCLCVAFCMLSACHRQDDGKVEACAFQDEHNSTWGLVNTDGTILMPAGSFSRQPSAVVGGMFTLPNKEGQFSLYATSHPDKPVTPRTFFRIGHFFSQVTLAQESSNGPILIVDKAGKDIASTAQYPQYDIVRMHNFSDGMALFVTGQGKYGYINTKGHVTVPPLYDVAYDFHEGIALVGMNNSQGKTGYQLINTDGQVTGNISLAGCLLDVCFSDKRLLFKNLHTGHLGYLDPNGNAVLYLPGQVLQASRVHHQLIAVHTHQGVGCMDSNGQMVFPATQSGASIVGENRIALNKDGQWGLMDNSGKYLTDFCFDTISCFIHDYAIVQDKKGYRFINRDGQPGNVYYAFIAEDSTASRLKPQLFTIERKKPHTATACSTETADDKAHEETIRPATNPHPRVQIENKNWQDITRQHPFYKEAAQIVSGKLKEQDAENRRMILNYVEHLRTSYTTKDIDFLEQLFSENALIVVGTVIHSAPQEEANYLPPPQVVYNVKSKRQYLDRLKAVFKANRSIDVQFSSFHIMRHPTLRGIYGVSLRQRYQSDLYSDDGYLFLLWDFRDLTAPKIHVRTWQPRMQPDHTPLPENEIFSIRNFNLQ